MTLHTFCSQIKRQVSLKSILIITLLLYQTYRPRLGLHAYNLFLFINNGIKEKLMENTTIISSFVDITTEIFT